MTSTPRPRLLDLFSGAGGAARGYQEAGFHVTGVDIENQPNYAGDEFWKADALWFLETVDPSQFDLIHASPPCQAFSTHTPKANKPGHPDLIEPTRRLLQATGRPFVIENVEGAPLNGYLKLCGSMFGMQIQRHRMFEIEGFPVMSLACNHKQWERSSPYTVTGHADGDSYDRRSGGKYLGFRDTAHAKELMGMPWAQTTREVTEAIPPAYTRFIGEQFLAQRVSL